MMKYVAAAWVDVVFAEVPPLVSNVAQDICGQSTPPPIMVLVSVASARPMGAQPVIPVSPSAHNATQVTTSQEQAAHPQLHVTLVQAVSLIAKPVLAPVYVPFVTTDS